MTDVIENEAQETSLRDDIAAAVAEVKEPTEAVEADKPEGRDESGRFKAKESTETQDVVDAPVVETPKVVDAPQGLSEAARAKWADLPEEVKSDIIRREEESHKLATRQDSERIFGTRMKEVVTPYLATIQAEGGTPEGAVKDLLNTAYVLRTAPPQQKVEIIRQVCQQYGVDIAALVQEPAYVDPAYADMQRQIEQLKQMANPDVIKKQLQEEADHATVVSEVNAFASDAKNVHYQQVKAVMASLFGTGQAKDLKEAYETACWADPTIRSTLLAKQQADDKAKRQAEIDAKRNAGSSIKGSPGAVVPNATPDRNLRDELRAQLRAHTS